MGGVHLIKSLSICKRTIVYVEVLFRYREGGC